MGRIRTIFALLALAATCIAPQQASAAGRTIDVELFGAPNQISPDPVIAAAGDTIRFNVINTGTHHLERYAQAGGDTTLDSGELRYGSGAVSYSTEFAGGTVRYRCTIHSSFDRSSGICGGMCGVLTNEDTIPVPPVIDAPRTIRERPATISGTAEPMTIVTIAEGSTVESGFYRGQALTDEVGRWAIKTVDFGKVSGLKPMIARAVRGVGYVSGDSAIVKYPYLYDSKVPFITFDPIPSPIFLDKIHFSGTVRDDVGVRRVEIQFALIQAPPTSQPTNITRTITILANCTPACPVSVPNLSIPWTLDLGSIAPGLYSVTGVGVDTSENRASMVAPTGLPSGLIVFIPASTVPAVIASSLPSPLNTIVPSISASPVVPIIPSPTVIPSPIPSPTVSP